MRRVFSSLLCAGLVLTLTAQAALAAKPVHDKFLIDETFTEELCGVLVTTHVEVKGNALIFADRLVDLSRVNITWTNADGDWLQLFIAGPVVLIEEWDGDILTQTARHMGLHHRLRSSEGIDAATFDRGRIIFRVVVDFSDPEEPVLISQQILFEAGPHPLAHSETDVFCEAVTEALG